MSQARRQRARGGVPRRARLPRRAPAPRRADRGARHVLIAPREATLSPGWRGALLVVVASGCAPEPSTTTWAALLDAPGAEVAGYTLGEPRRGHEHDVVVEARGPAGQVVEVHVVDAGRWAGAHETRSYGVDWEAPRTTAPKEDADAVTRAIADLLATRDPGLPDVDEVPLGVTPPTPRDRVLATLARFGTRAVLPIFVPLALLLSLLSLRGAGERTRRIARDGAGAFLVALALRLGLGAYGPLHTNGQGDLWVTGALHPSELAHYGPGYAELFGLVARLGPPDTAIYVANAALSSCLPALAIALAHRLGLGRGRALAAALLLAVDPVAIRIAATESYHVSGALLAAWAGLLATGRRRSALVAIALLGAAAARLHPTAWVPLALSPLLAARQGPRAVLGAIAAAGLGAVLGSGVVIADVLRAVAGGGLAAPAVGADVVRVAVGVLGAVLLVAVPRARVVAPAALAAWTADLVLRVSYGQGPVWQLAFDRLFAVPIVLGAVALLPEAVLRPRVAAASGVLVTLVSLVGGWPVVRSRTIDDAEHAWSRTWLATVPAGCEVLYVAHPDPIVTVRLPPAPGVTLVPIDARGDVALAPLITGDCAYYVRTSACGTTTGEEACTRVEAGLALVEVARGTLPAVPNHRDVRYPGTTVQVAAFRAGLAP